jgi:hypothetical protein
MMLIIGFRMFIPLPFPLPPSFPSRVDWPFCPVRPAT